MAGIFDSNVFLLDFGPSGTIATNAGAVTSLGDVVVPFDCEIVTLGAAATKVSNATAADLTTAYNNLFVDFQVAASGGTLSSLTVAPASAFTTNIMKVDQGIVTVGITGSNATNASSTINGTFSATSVVTVASGTNFAEGGGIYGAGIPIGTRIVSKSTNDLTLDRNVTTTNSGTVTGYVSPIPVAGQTVTIAGVTNNASTDGKISGNFFKSMNNDWVVLDSSATTTTILVKIGPLKQSALYDTNTGFWNFTTTDSSNATSTVLAYGTTTTAGTLQVTNAVVLPATNGYVADLGPAGDKGLNVLKAGSRIHAECRTVNLKGKPGDSAATVTGVVASLTVRKV
jgi:hypothetical protein